jgi:hypothetical protein
MIRTNKNTHGVTSLTFLAGSANPQIGVYHEHYINDVDFSFAVRLTNGSIRIPQENAEDYERDPRSVSQEKVNRIANSFKKS